MRISFTKMATSWGLLFIRCLMPSRHQKTSHGKINFMRMIERTSRVKARSDLEESFRRHCGTSKGPGPPHSGPRVAPTLRPQDGLLPPTGSPHLGRRRLHGRLLRFWHLLALAERFLGFLCEFFQPVGLKGKKTGSNSNRSILQHTMHQTKRLPPKQAWLLN